MMDPRLAHLSSKREGKQQPTENEREKKKVHGGRSSFFVF
jgi:hypothetical protein